MSGLCAAQITQDTFGSRSLSASRIQTRPRAGRTQDFRRGRQEDSAAGGVDFSGCETDYDTGLCCVDKEETIRSLEKDPILKCTHKNTKQCHYTYVTLFKPSQEEVCGENFEKKCSITYKQQAFNEKVRKCYTPTEKVCNGYGEEVCETVYESSCTTKYLEKQPGKFVADTGCEKLPVEICGAGCVFKEGTEECHDKTVASVVDVPEESCDLSPQKTCRLVTKLVPRLSPKHECTIVPKETCVWQTSAPRQVRKPLKTRWCLDPAQPSPGDSYGEEHNLAAKVDVRSLSDIVDIRTSAGPESFDEEHAKVDLTSLAKGVNITIIRTA